jgi:hypothetical protein
MNCGICSKKLTGKAKKICPECNSVKHKVECIKCNNIQYVTAHYYIKINPKNNTCKKCVNKSLVGENNPNYGNKWSDGQKSKQSNLIKSKVDDEYRFNCSKGMKGRKVSDTVKLKRRNTLLKKYGSLKTMKTHTKESKEIIGIKSKQKWTDEYKRYMREANEKAGNYIPLIEKDDYLFYREISNWKDLILNDGIIGIGLLKQYSFYSKNNRNKNGLVRDHMYSRRLGFQEKVFPEILKHPANCQLLTHSDNIKKSKLKHDSIITLDELFERIESWPYHYENKNECISLITEYRKGNRYLKQNYINKYHKL